LKFLERVVVLGLSREDHTFLIQRITSGVFLQMWSSTNSRQESGK
jgi:hypothetical protein